MGQPEVRVPGDILQVQIPCHEFPEKDIPGLPGLKAPPALCPDTVSAVNKHQQSEWFKTVPPDIAVVVAVRIAYSADESILKIQAEKPAVGEDIVHHEIDSAIKRDTRSCRKSPAL